MTDSTFDALHAAMRAQVDQQFLPGVSPALLRQRRVVDRFWYGHAEREAGVVLPEDHNFRMFSTTKPGTSSVGNWMGEGGQRRRQ